MRSKRLIMALIVAIMMISAVACGSDDKTEDSKSTDETTKEVSSTLAPTEAAITATEATTQTVTEATTKANNTRRTAINHRIIHFDSPESKFSEETCKNIAEYFANKTFVKGDIIDLSQIQYTSEEEELMNFCGFTLYEMLPRDKYYYDGNYLSFEWENDSELMIKVTYDSEGIKFETNIIYEIKTAATEATS